MPRLRRSDCTKPGISRRRAGKGFTYVDVDGRRVTDDDVLSRIRALVIPPAWSDVWICTDPNGHIQAVGVDAAGRKQYRYHDAWRARRDAEKFDHMLDFAHALPRLRRRLTADLAGEELSHERVLACAVRLLDLGFFRIGGEAYAEQNQSYGLATMQKSHVSTSGDGVVTFEYTAKSGIERMQSVVDPEVHAVVRALKRRRSGGDELFAWRAERRWIDVKSSDINDYIKAATGDDFTAKDFRTWNATVLAAVALAVSTAATTPTARKRAVRRAICEVAEYLGNTPTVCRTSYVDPRVIDCYENGVTVRTDLDKLGEGASFGQLATQGAIERAVLRMLSSEGLVKAA